jgi:hypothetical protein
VRPLCAWKRRECPTYIVHISCIQPRRPVCCVGDRGIRQERGNAHEHRPQQRQAPAATAGRPARQRGLPRATASGGRHEAQRLPAEPLRHGAGESLQSRAAVCICVFATSCGLYVRSYKLNGTCRQCYCTAHFLCTASTIYSPAAHVLLRVSLCRLCGPVNSRE